jgi:hypothetical protein
MKDADLQLNETQVQTTNIGDVSDIGATRIEGLPAQSCVSCKILGI